MHMANPPKQSFSRTRSMIRSISPGGKDIGMERKEGDGYLTYGCTTGFIRTTGAKIVQPFRGNLVQTFRGLRFSCPFLWRRYA